MKLQGHKSTEDTAASLRTITFRSLVTLGNRPSQSIRGCSDTSAIREPGYQRNIRSNVYIRGLQLGQRE